MVVEAKASLISSVITQRSLKPLFTGERTWSPLTENQLLSVTSNNGDTRVEAVSPAGKEAILYERTKMHHSSGTVIREERVRASGDEINDPGKPWYGRIRQVNP